MGVGMQVHIGLVILTGSSIYARYCVIFVAETIAAIKIIKGIVTGTRDGGIEQHIAVCRICGIIPEYLVANANGKSIDLFNKKAGIADSMVKCLCPGYMGSVRRRKLYGIAFIISACDTGPVN